MVQIYIEFSCFRDYNKNLRCFNCLKITFFVPINNNTPFLAVMKGILLKVIIILEKWIAKQNDQKIELKKRR